MANDIIDINVSETVDSVSITVNPNLTTVNINQVTGGLNQTLQSVTDLGATTTNSITANSFVKSGGTSAQILAANGSVITAGTNITISGGTISSTGGAGGATNLTTSQTSTNFTINSDTGTDAIVPLGNGTLAGATLNDYTTAEKNKLAAITGINTGNQDLQSVTDIGATTTNGIYINGITNDYGLVVETNSNNYPSIYVDNSATGINANGIEANALTGVTAKIYNQAGVGIRAEAVSGIPIIVYGNGNNTSSIDVNLGNTNKGLVINSGTSSTGNPIEVNKNGVNKLTVNQQGDITATTLIKQGGTSSQILAADGSVITAGTNITITGGQISSVGGAGGGGSSVNYYLNGGTSQGTFGGSTYYEFSKTAVIGTGADFNRNTNGYIASFITDVADPSLLLIPAGNWNLEFFFSSSSAGGSPSFYAELYKYDGTTFTLIASDSANPEGITNGTAIDAYFTPLAVPETVLTVNDRLAIRVYVNASGKTITLHTQNGHLCEVITTFTAGLTALNGLQAQVQNFATGTTGTDFAINSSGSTHTFNLPTASASNRGALSSANWTTFNNKQDTLQSTVNIKSINGNTLLGSGDLVISGTGISSLNGLTGATQTFSVLTNVTGSPSFSSTGTNHQLRLPSAAPNADYGLITNTTQNIGGTKIFESNPAIPVPAGNSGPCIVLGSAGGGGATGTLSIGDTVTYPNGVEMQRVKGVTSNIQTQLDGKQPTLTAGNGINITSNTISTVDTSRAAYTMLANNTNASAIPTTQPFENLTNQVYSSTIVWTGGTAPSGTTDHTYSLSQIGNLVTLTINLAYGTAAGATVSSVTMELPSTAPTPALPSSVTTALDVINYGSGMIISSKALPTTAAAFCALRLKSTSPNVFEIVISRVASTHRYAYATIQYFV
jgi:hypothetical protein